jgi:anti-sigma factor ChrR (cupin superfamily)
LKINADLGKRAVENSEELPWIPSPMNGVARRMLERDGDEVARATSLVRYDPGSYFSPHTHTGGEEFLVLKGVFSDEMGDFSRGYYVRNPVGSSHQPHSENGCVILVKLWQMPPEDQEFVRINIFDDKNWRALSKEDNQLVLHQSNHEFVEARKWAAGYSAEYVYPKGAEIFVIEGAFEDDDGTYPQGSWVRMEPGSSHRPGTKSGCLLYIKSGHLTADLPRPV